MFSFECIQSRGHAIGLCVQGLFVGTCCIVRKGTSMHLPSYDNMTNTSGHNSLLTTSTALPATIEHAASVASSHSIKAARFETQSIDSLQTHSYDVIYATVMESSTVASVDSTTSPLIDQTKLVQVELISLPNATADTKDSTSADAKQTNANSSINLSNDISDVKYQVIALHQTESFSKSDSSTTSTIASSSPTTWVKNDDLLTSTTHSQAAKSEAETTLSNDLHSKTRIDYISTTSGLNVTLQTIASESVPTNTPYSLLSSNQTDSNVAHSPPDSLTTAGVLPSNTSRNEYDFSLVSQNEKYTFVTTTSTVEMTTRAHSHYAESSTNTESSSEQPITSSSISSNSTEPTIDLASKLSESSSNQVTMPAYVSATPASTEIVQSTHANIIENTFSPIDQVSTMKYESVSISMTTTTTPASLFHPKKGVSCLRIFLCSSVRKQLTNPN